LSCSTPKELQYQSYHNLKLQQIGFDHSTLSLDLVYFNPNNFRLQLKRSDIDVFINGSFLGHSSFDTLIRIPKRDTFSIPVVFNLNMKNLYKNLWLTLGGKEVSVKLTGKLMVGKANVFMTMPVNYETSAKFNFY
jgi:LEA14-like dessication related protein